MQGTGTMNLKNQNLLLSILCVLLLMAVLGLLVWIWFGNQIDYVDYQIKNLG